MYMVHVILGVTKCTLEINDFQQHNTEQKRGSIMGRSGDMDITAFKPAHFYRVVNGRMRKISVDEPYVMFAENLR